MVDRLDHMFLEIVTPALNLSSPGIYYDPDCSSENLDHGILVVGYGSQGEDSEKQKYWIVKNRYKKPKIGTSSWLSR